MNHSNRFYQIYSTIQGLKFLLKNPKIEYIIKLRGDHYYQDFNFYIENLLNEKNKIHATSLFTRKDVPYHISDHIIGGSSDNVLLYYSSTYEYLYTMTIDTDYLVNELSRKENKRILRYENSDLDNYFSFKWLTIPPEVLFTYLYLKNKGEKDVVIEKSNELLKKYFNVVSTKKFVDFDISANSVGLVINPYIYQNYENYILNYQNCDKCHPNIMCPERYKQALSLLLMRNKVENNNDFNIEFNDLNVHNGIWSCYKNLPEFSWRIDV
jgi:hypothetical protein